MGDVADGELLIGGLLGIADAELGIDAGRRRTARAAYSQGPTGGSRGRVHRRVWRLEQPAAVATARSDGCQGM